MDRVDAALGMEQWDEKATLARAAHAACFSTCCETSNPQNTVLYMVYKKLLLVIINLHLNNAILVRPPGSGGQKRPAIR